MADLPAEVNVAIDVEIAELEGRMRTPGEWFHDHAGQERIKELYEQQDTGTTPSPAPAPAAQRMAVIEQAMTDSAGEYWKSTEMQTEYLAILEAEDAKDVSEAGDVSPVDWANMPADVIGNEIIEATGVTEAEVAELVEWTGTDPASVAEGFAHARAFWDGMAELAGPDGYQAIYEAYTTELPTEVMRGVDCELCMDAPYYEPAGAGEVTRFNQTSAGALASQQWGSQSEARLGVLTARWARMTDGLSDPDFKALDGFIRNRLSPRERAWVWTALAT